MGNNNIETIFAILQIAEPLILRLVGDDNQEAAEKVIDTAEGLMGLLRQTVAGSEVYAEELQEIALDLKTIEGDGGLDEEDFYDIANRLPSKVEKLREVIAARKTLE